MQPLVETNVNEDAQTALERAMSSLIENLQEYKGRLGNMPERQKTEKELALEVSTGLSYRVASRFWLGLEGRYHSVYPDWTHGLHRENYAVYGGPTAHYDGGKWSLTATWLPQLFGSPSESGSSLELDDHEKTEFRLKLSYEF